MSHRELQDWATFWACEPWGAWRDNLHAGLIAAEIRSQRRRRGQAAPTPKDFMLKSAADAQDERIAGTPKTLAALRAMAKRKKAK